MKTVKKYIFGGNLEGYSFGFSWVGQPLMSVFIYLADGLLIDSAQSNMRKEVLSVLRDKVVNQVLLTHHHEDHCGNAAAIKKAFHASVHANPLAVSKMSQGFRIKPYQRMVWGKADKIVLVPYPSEIETELLKLQPIHTPGHSNDHTVYLDQNNGRLFSGDLFLGEKIKYFRSDENILGQISSLKKILKYDFDSLFCAHNPAVKNGKKKLRNKLSFLEDFYGNILGLAEKGLSEKQIIKLVDPKQDRKIKWITMGNASWANMARSALRSVNFRV